MNNKLPTIDISDDENEDWLRTAREKLAPPEPAAPLTPSTRTKQLKKFAKK